MINKKHLQNERPKETHRGPYRLEVNLLRQNKYEETDEKKVYLLSKHTKDDDGYASFM